MFRLDELDEVLTRYGLPLDEGVPHRGYATRPFEVYVEVQLWSDGPVAELIERRSEDPDR